MFCGRSALMMLATCTLFGCASCGSQFEHPPADRLHSTNVDHSEPSSVWPHIVQPGSRPAISCFTPWKSRIKSVLEETDPKVIEERDLGPVIVPGHRLILGTFLCAVCPLPTFPPLRC
jgi:hypothetical protein